MVMRDLFYYLIASANKYKYFLRVLNKNDLVSLNNKLLVLLI